MHACEHQTSNVGDMNEDMQQKKLCTENSASKELQYPLIYST